MTAREVYRVGTRVKKVSGYSFPGEIRSAYTSRSGQLRYVVEAVIPTGECEGMQHIFNPDQITLDKNYIGNDLIDQAPALPPPVCVGPDAGINSGNEMIETS